MLRIALFHAVLRAHGRLRRTSQTAGGCHSVAVPHKPELSASALAPSVRLTRPPSLGRFQRIRYCSNGAFLRACDDMAVHIERR